MAIAALLAGCAPTPPSDEDPSIRSQPTTPSATERSVEPEQKPADVVEALGSRLDMVSILAPPEVVEETMRDSWGGLVDPPLLERWISAPADSPGRATSSPRPDRIEVEETTLLGEERAAVRGVLVESASGADTARIPVRIELERRNGRWMITKFTREARPAEATGDALGAVRVVEDFYASINAGDYRRAWNLWGPSGAPGQTFEQFAAGYASTESVQLEAGEPSRVEGAAGSRYVEVPVTITARQNDGSMRRFAGRYTLRRSVVDGASEAQRQWHLYRADVRPVTAP